MIFYWIKQVGGMKLLPFILISSLLLLSACSNDTITARPIDEQVISVEVDVKSNLCDQVSCDDNSKCVSGECVCDSGFKRCEKECISENLCCDSGDCSLGEFCEEGICMRHVCPFNQIFNSKKQKCVCDDASKWCSLQDKCIPKANCCVHADCGNDYACAETYFLALVCVDDSRERCRSTLEGQNSVFYINGISYDITVENVSEDFVSLRVNELMLDALPLNTPYELTENSRIYIEETRMVGGSCKKV